MSFPNPAKTTYGAWTQASEASADLETRLNQRGINVKDAPYNAIGDGATHPLSGFFATLALAQAVYPHVSSLTQEWDWAAIQGALNALSATGGTVYLPATSGVSYFIGTTTLTINGATCMHLVGETVKGYIKYSGTTFAINVDSGDGVSRITNLRFERVGVVCTNPAGSAFRFARVLFGSVTDCYAENGQAGCTGTGYIQDGVGGFTTNFIFQRCRSNDFFIGFEARATGLNGEVVTASDIVDCAVNGQVAQIGAGTMGFKIRGATTHMIDRGHVEICDYAVNFGPAANGSPCVQCTVDSLAAESINTLDVLIDATTTKTLLINPPCSKGISDLSADTVIIGNNNLATNLGRQNGNRLNPVNVVCVNGANGLLNVGNTKYVRITGPTGAFNFTGFFQPPLTGSSVGADGRELEVEYLGAQALTVVVNDGPAGLCSIRSLSADGGTNVVCGTPFGVYLQFRYNATQGQWILMNKR